MQMRNVWGFLKDTARKFWHIVWEEDSVLSWIFNIGLAFLLMKFLIYPGLGLILNTSHPVVAVISGSMEHNALEFDEWYDNQKDFYTSYNISKERFSDFPLANGINTGDIIVLTGPPAGKIKLGDIIVFTKSGPEPIIHRTVRKWERDNESYFETKGDNNARVTSIDKSIHEDNVLGKAVFRIPFLGYVKIWFTRFVVCTINPKASTCPG